jgi:hypothetical protein
MLCTGQPLMSFGEIVGSDTGVELSLTRRRGRTQEQPAMEFSAPQWKTILKISSGARTWASW